MNYTAALEQIKTGRIQPLYLLYGEETYLARQLERTLTGALLTPEERDTNLLTLDYDPRSQELITLIETVPFLGGKNVIVVRGTALFRARKGAGGDSGEEADHDKSDDRLMRIFSNMPEYSHVIFTTTEKVDKRRKIYKALEKNGAAVEMTPLKPKDVRSWLTMKLADMKKKMAPDALEHLMAMVSLMPQVSLGFLDNELEKISLYIGDDQVISYKALTNVLSAVPEISAFVMLDAVSQRQVQKALKLLGEQLGAGEHPLRIIALLAREVRILWQTKEMLAKGYGTRQVADNLGLPAFIGELKARQSKSFSSAKLKQAMLSLAGADSDLKSGQAGNVVVEKIIIEMCQ